MNNIVVGRYANPQAVGYFGWIEPEDKSWIAFIDLDNRPVVFLTRDANGGVV